MPRAPRNPADRVLRIRVREPIEFRDLTGRLALKLSSVADYTDRSHFEPWHKLLGSPDFSTLTGVFTPFIHVEVAVTDIPLDPHGRLDVHGETFLARTVDPQGNLRHLIRVGDHRIHAPDGALAATVRLVNAFTRYDPDPARRRVTSLPAEWGLGPGPSRIVRDVPAVDTLVPSGRPPDFADDTPHVWHYGHTDANRHVNGMEYLRTAESLVADGLLGRGLDLSRLHFARARIVYRKPCFAGDAYRREAWYRGEAPLVLACAIRRVDDPPGGPPAAAVELALAGHEDAGAGGPA